MHDEIVGRLLKVPSEHLVWRLCVSTILTSKGRERRTIGLRSKIGYDISDPDVDDAEEALILLLELLLVEHLYG